MPAVRFSRALDALLALALKHELTLPPYFLNNARAIATLEGMARAARPDFNIIAKVYPFALRRLLANPAASPTLQTARRRLTADPRTGRFSARRAARLVRDASRSRAARGGASFSTRSRAPAAAPSRATRSELLCVAAREGAAIWRPRARTAVIKAQARGFYFLAQLDHAASASLASCFASPWICWCLCRIIAENDSNSVDARKSCK